MSNLKLSKQTNSISNDAKFQEKSRSWCQNCLVFEYIIVAERNKYFNN